MQINNLTIKKEFDINSIYKIISRVPNLIKLIKVDQKGLFIDKLFQSLTKIENMGDEITIFDLDNQNDSVSCMIYFEFSSSLNLYFSSFHGRNYGIQINTEHDELKDSISNREQFEKYLMTKKIIFPKTLTPKLFKISIKSEKDTIAFEHTFKV